MSILTHFATTCELVLCDISICGLMIKLAHTFVSRTLAYSVSKTRFFIGRAPYQPVVRKMVITNTFTFPLVIYRVVTSPDVQDFVSVSMLAYTIICTTYCIQQL